MIRVPAEDRLAEDSPKIDHATVELRALKKGAKFSVICDKGKIFEAKLKGFSSYSYDMSPKIYTAELVLGKRPDSAYKESFSKQYLVLGGLKINQKQTGIVKKTETGPKEVVASLNKALPSEPEEEQRNFFQLRSKDGPAYIVASMTYRLKTDFSEAGRHSYSELWVISRESVKKLQSFKYSMEPISFTDLDMNGKWELLYDYSTVDRVYGTDFSEIEDHGLKKLKSVTFHSH